MIMRSIQDERKQRDEKRKKESLALTQEMEDIQSLLELPQARRYLIRLIARLRYFEDNMTGNSHTFHHLGQHKAAVRIIDDMNIAGGERAKIFMGELNEYRYRRKPGATN